MTGHEVRALLTPDPLEEPFVFLSCLSYSEVITTHFQAKESFVPAMHEKIAFALHWLCPYVLAVPGFNVTKEYVNVVLCMA